jgi:diaminopimelate epimerase
MQLPFTKMHGLGNDFMVLDLISHPASLSAEQIRQLADRNFGIGFDQLLMIEPPSQPDVDFDYRIFNADGSEVEHCGNGARCFARFVLDRGLIKRTPIRVKTVNKIIELDVLKNGLIIVDMGVPDFEPAALPFDATQSETYQLETSVAGQLLGINFRAVSVGNPHAVIEVNDVDQAPVHQIGPALGAHPAFPKGVNVGFMQIIDRTTIHLRVLERGAGETAACGTGACAAVVAGIQGGMLDNDVKVILRGGILNISWAGNSHPILMQGPASTVYEGIVTL